MIDPNPDFKRLGETTGWSAIDWLQVWNVLTDHHNWPIVVEFAISQGRHPVHEASAVNEASKGWRP